MRIAEALQIRPDDLLGFGTGDDVSAHARLIARLTSATQGLKDDVIEIVVVQAEALLAAHRSKPSGA